MTRMNTNSDQKYNIYYILLLEKVNMDTWFPTQPTLVGVYEEKNGK